MIAASSRAARGRYGSARDASPVQRGLASRPMPSLEARTRVGAVPNPLAPSERIRVAINTAVDVLELERSNRRISERAYGVGRMIQQVWEAGSGSLMGSPSGAERVGGDPGQARERTMIRRLETAGAVVNLDHFIRRMIGEIGLEYLRGLLVGGSTFRSYVEARGLVPSERNIKAAAQRFRDLIEDLAKAMEA